MLEIKYSNCEAHHTYSVSAPKKQNIPPFLQSVNAPTCSSKDPLVMALGRSQQQRVSNVVCSNVYLCSPPDNYHLTKQAATQYANNDSDYQWWRAVEAFTVPGTLNSCKTCSSNIKQH